MLKSKMNVNNNFSRNLQKGAVAIVVALSLPVLIGMAGLALDLGKLYVTKTELQNAADACALSAANELKGTADGFAAAETAGREVGQANKAYFQKDAVVLPVNDAVTFSKTLNGTYVTKAALTGLTPAQSVDYKFVKCTANKGEIANFLVSVLNVIPGVKVADKQSVKAAAVATLAPSQSTCAVPIAVCKADVDTAAVGTWLKGVIGPDVNGDGSQATGAFKWSDFTGGGGGAKEIKDLLTGEPCVDPLPLPPTNLKESGFKGGARNAYNTRFGLESSATSGIADKVGFSYYSGSKIVKVKGKDTEVPTGNWASKANAYNDYLTKSNSSNSYPYQEGNPFDGSTTGIELNGSTKNVSLGNSTNRRVAVAPVIDCTNSRVTAYACIFLLHPIQTKYVGQSFDIFIEYLGNANTVGPCNQSGLAGNSTSVGPLTPALVQ